MTISADLRASFNSLTELSWLSQDKWWLLEGTGFNVRTQIEKLIKESRQKGALSEAIKVWLGQTKEDLQGFWLEYICQKLVLPIQIEKVEIKGKEQIICPRYGHQPLLETVSEQERNGAVTDSLTRIIDFLLKAPPGSMAIFVSPAGWSGLKTSEGKDISYPETQIYAYHVEKSGKIKAVTIRTDNTLAQNETFVGWLKNQELGRASSDNLQERIENVTRNPVFLEGSSEDFGFDKLARALQIIRNSSFVLKNRTFRELLEDLKNIERISVVDQKTSALIETFADFVTNSTFASTPKSLELIAEKLGKTVLEISAAKRVLDNHLSILPLDEWFYRKELDYLRTIGGCNGGGLLGLSNPTLMFGLGTARSIILGEGNTQRKHCGKCGKSGYFTEGETCPYDSKDH